MRKRIIDTTLFCGIIGIVLIILFHNYIWGEKYFLFSNVVEDGVVQFYPEYYQKAQNGIGNSFSFSSSWGSASSNYDPFVILIGIFGSRHVAYMMGIVMMIKCALSGYVFYAFLREKGMERVTCIVFGCCYAFSIQVIGGGCWKTQAEVAMIAAIFLWAIERWKKKRSLLLFAIGVVLSILCLSLYFQLMLAVFLLLYVIAEVYQSGYKSKKHFSTIQKKVIVICSIVFLVVVAGILYQELTDIFHSYRFQTGVQSFGTEWKKTFSYENIKIIATMMMRTLAPNVMGIPGANEYYGRDTGWYIGDGSYYCGILALLLIPQVFHRDTQKRNIVVATELTICGMIATCPVFRLLINGFANDIYKLSRVWVIIIMLMTSATAFNEIITKKRRIKEKRLLITWGITVIAIGIVCFKLRERIYYYDIFMYLLISMLEVLGLCLYNRKKIINEKVLQCGFIILTMIEAVSFNYKFINNDDAVKKDDWITGYYNDGTTEILEQTNEKEIFERVDKTYLSVQMNDAPVQGYNGTSYYIGGVGNSEFTDLVTATSIPTLRKMPGWCLGITGNIYLESMFSVDKLISGSDNCSNYGFYLENTLDNKYLYQNNNSLPLGFCYDKVISSSMFEEMDPLERAESLLKYAVVEDKNEEFKKWNTGLKEEQKEMKSIYKDEVADYAVGSVIELPVEITSDETIVVELQNEEEASVHVCWATNDGRNGYQYASCYEKNGKTKTEFSGQDGIKYITIYDNMDNTVENIDKVKISIFSSAEYYEEFENDVSARKRNVLDIQEYSDEYICGTIESEKDQLLFLSIPYSANFKYYLDGEEVRKERVNMAFTGLYLPAGTHQMEAIYQKNFWKDKFVVSVVVMLVWVILTSMQRIRKKRSLKN
ncbi:YfhO family protein [Roseburia sp. 499]|uniref:YfhO family protein n=1 Tax=Roseburia sp. 499 TaxID=1261634 RepID=UPI000952828B|nr:YfhO family protein [Roseburia sp. 499]WVK69291.1 YfhO family protein [Roseburia sp. 499]